MYTRWRKQMGFTIVELLVVIVVIGVLATITVISFSGIQERAIVASLQSDLNNAAKKLKIDYVLNGAYPATLAAADGGKGINPSPGNTFSNYVVDNISNPKTFALQATGSGNVTYRITENSKPTIVNESRKSCYEILHNNESTGSGVYWIKPVDTVLPVYCDMLTSGGGWTLLVTSTSSVGWNTTNVLSNNVTSPSIHSNYSILDKADSIKTDIGGNLQYKLDATNLGRWGGVWSAPYSYTFTKTDNTQTAVNQIEKYDAYTYPLDAGIEARMPWLGGGPGILTTSALANSNWWGTIIGTSYLPAPWISSQNPNPGKIWYWVR